MLSQFFILSSRGDTLAFRDFRGDVVRGTPEIFYRRIKALKKFYITPIFHVEGTQFLHVIKSGLYFVCTTKQNVSPVFVLELLNKIASICKDYCGVLNEEAIRVNFPLVYEILDEILDFGYPQCTSTELLKDYVFNGAQPLQQQLMVNTVSPSAAHVFGIEKRSIPSSAPDKSVISSRKSEGKNEVYIDILENITATFAGNGHIVRSEINGCVKVRSFLAGNPEIRMSLNENIKVKNSDSIPIGLSHEVEELLLDDCCFHDCIDADEFERSRCLIFKPQAGLCSVMTYRINSPFLLPFQVYPFIEITGNQIGLRLNLKCVVPKMFHAVTITMKIPAPKTTTSVSHDVSTGANTIEYKSKEKIVVWSIRKMVGGSEHNAYIKYTIPIMTNMSKKEVGPISLDFEFPMYVSSRLQIKNLKVTERNAMYTPMRWIRYITHSDSYVTRL